MILHLPPGSPLLLRDAATSVLVLHIGAGLVGIASGGTALLARKGEGWHRTAGNVFFVSMTTMSGIGACVAPFLPVPQWSSVAAGTFTFYLVTTAWVTVRRKQGGVGRFEVGALLVALAMVAAFVSFILRAAASPTGEVDGAPAQAGYVFATVAALAAAADLSVILRGGLSGAQRIARHLWRMCLALFIAAGSFFLGQPQVFPHALRGSPIMFAPEVAVLGLMLFWLCRLGFTRQQTRTVAMSV